MREMSIRGWASYSDLTVLGSGLQARQLVSLLTNCAVKVTAVCLTTYAAGFLTLLGTTAALARTPLGPTAVSDSVQTLSQACAGVEEPEPRTDPETDLRLSPADLLTASLLVATLTSVSHTSTWTH